MKETAKERIIQVVSLSVSATFGIMTRFSESLEIKIIAVISFAFLVLYTIGILIRSQKRSKSITCQVVWKEDPDASTFKQIWGEVSAEDHQRGPTPKVKIRNIDLMEPKINFIVDTSDETVIKIFIPKEQFNYASSVAKYNLELDISG